MVGGITDVTERKQAETALQESEERFRALTEHSIDTIIRFDHQHRYLYVNPIVERGTGIAPEAFIGKTNREMGFPEDQCMLWTDAIEKVFQTGKVNRIEFKLPTGMWLDWLLAPEFDALGKVSAVVTAARDITERKKAEADRERIEAELRQAQKMEAVGLLAGGVAHDFNNMLNVILGYAEIALSSLNARDPLYQHLLEIKKAGLRSADLTRQLLAFSRKQIVEPRVLHLNEVIANQQQMLARLIGEDIEIDFAPAGDLWTIRVDPVQIDQILANLAVNARDAIAGVGTVSVETANVVLDETYIRNHVYVTPGEYVMLAFSDTGAGMDADTLKRIFEPFFSTKDKAKGTGLGLSTVYGIVKQNKGYIHAYSEPGMGTTFKIYFPRFQGKAAAPAEKTEAASGTGTETVLIVEDEQQVLSLAREVLKRYGYQVLTASTPGEACQLVEKHEGQIHLLLTDVVMPAMNGKELQTRIQKIKPGLKTLFMSGYTANVIAQRGVLEEGVEFIQKPFSVASLAQKVRQVLDA
jgi:PAS domain S-box-containing protein